METFLFCWRLSRTVRRKVRHGATRTISSRDTHTKKIIYNFVCVYPHAGREQEVAFGWGTPVQMTGGGQTKIPPHVSVGADQIFPHRQWTSVFFGRNERGNRNIFFFSFIGTCCKSETAGCGMLWIWSGCDQSEHTAGCLGLLLIIHGGVNNNDNWNMCLIKMGAWEMVKSCKSRAVQ